MVSGTVKAAQLPLRLVPEERRIRRALEQFAKMNEIRPDTQIELQEKESYFLLFDEDYCWSKGVTSQTPGGGIYNGTLQAFMKYIAGRQHEGEEMECLMRCPLMFLKHQKRQNKEFLFNQGIKW